MAGGWWGPACAKVCCLPSWCCLWKPGELPCLTRACPPDVQCADGAPGAAVLGELEGGNAAAAGGQGCAAVSGAVLGTNPPQFCHSSACADCGLDDEFDCLQCRLGCLTTKSERSLSAHSSAASQPAGGALCQPTYWRRPGVLPALHSCPARPHVCKLEVCHCKVLEEGLLVCRVALNKGEAGGVIWQHVVGGDACRAGRSAAQVQNVNYNSSMLWAARPGCRRQVKAHFTLTNCHTRPRVQSPHPTIASPHPPMCCAMSSGMPTQGCCSRVLK